MQATQGTQGAHHQGPQSAHLEPVVDEAWRYGTECEGGRGEDEEADEVKQLPAS